MKLLSVSSYSCKESVTVKYNHNYRIPLDKGNKLMCNPAELQHKLGVDNFRTAHDICGKRFTSKQESLFDTESYQNSVHLDAHQSETTKAEMYCVV